MKKVLIWVVVLGLLLLGGTVIKNSSGVNQDYREEKNITDYQKSQLEEDMQNFDTATNKMLPPVTAGDRDKFSDLALNQRMISSDNALKVTLEQGILAEAEIYKATNENYGRSTSENFCIKNIPVDLLKKSSTLVECMIAPVFPSQTFTVIAQANAQSGYFCTDQNGFAGLITDLTSIRRGVSCK